MSAQLPRPEVAQLIPTPTWCPLATIQPEIRPRRTWCLAHLDHSHHQVVHFIVLARLNQAHFTVLHPLDFQYYFRHQKCQVAEHRWIKRAHLSYYLRFRLHSIQCRFDSASRANFLLERAYNPEQDQTQAVDMQARS